VPVAGCIPGPGLGRARPSGDCQLAWAQLTPHAKSEVSRLLAPESGESLASISTWADEQSNPGTSPWHYVSFPRGSCVYQRERDCPDGQCVVEAIEKQTEVLASKASDDKRLLALKYLLHFVGDVHQPLHAGYGDDRGGNKYQIQAFGHGSNLHAFWDSGLIKTLQDDTDSLSQSLLVKTPKGATAPWNAAQAAQASCRIVASDGFYPGRFMEQDYVQAFTPVMENQLVTAGARLAELVNRVLR
jgi:nuclease S1